MAENEEQKEKTTKEINQERLQNYVEAERKALEAQQYTDGKVQLQRASLRNIRSGIDALMSSSSDDGTGISGGGLSFRQVVLKE